MLERGFYECNITWEYWFEFYDFDYNFLYPILSYQCNLVFIYDLGIIGGAVGLDAILLIKN